MRRGAAGKGAGSAEGRMRARLARRGGRLRRCRRPGQGRLLATHSARARRSAVASARVVSSGAQAAAHVPSTTAGSSPAGKEAFVAGRAGQGQGWVRREGRAQEGRLLDLMGG